MSAAADALPMPRRPGLVSRFLHSGFVSVLVIVGVILAIWYVAAVLMNAGVLASTDKRKGIERTPTEFVLATYEMDRPLLPAPHQIAIEVYDTTAGLWYGERERDICPPLDTFAGETRACKKSLFYHAWVTLSATLLGFGIGSLLGVVLAVLIVHVRSLALSLMPWVISSQTVPILAIAPMVIVAFAAFNVTGLLPKAFISTYLSFFPVTVGMVKGLRSPDPFHLDLMRTYNASAWQTFRKVRWPAALPYLFVSMKIAIAASVVGAIVAELPTGAVAGLGARLLSGSYYGQTIQIWSALIVASLMAGVLVGLVGLAHRISLRRTGASA